MTTRPAPQRDYLTAEESVFCVARFTPDPDNPDKTLTLTEVAARMGWTEDQLGDRTSNHRQRFAVEWIAPLTKATSNFAIIRTLCRQVGMIAVPAAKSNCAPADLLHGITDLSREFSESVAAMTSCLDGTTAREKLDAIQQLTELMERAAAAREQLQAQVAR